MAAMLEHRESGALVICCALCGAPLHRFLPSEVKKIKRRFRGAGDWEESDGLAKWAENLAQAHMDEGECYVL